MHKNNREWLNIAGTDGRYQVSSDGYVRSLPDIDHRGQFMLGKILRPAINEKGYEYVSVNRKSRRVHILVASAFVENPDNKPQVNHEDGNKRNNKSDNLTWVTNGENQVHRYEVLGHISHLKGKTGAACANSKPVRSIDIITKSVTLYAAADEAAEAGRALGIDGSGISLAANGKLQTYKGHRWEWAT